MRKLIIVFCFAVAGFCNHGIGQDATDVFQPSIPAKYFDKVSGQAKSISQSIQTKSERLLAALEKQELKIQKVLSKADSAKAADFFESGRGRYQQLIEKISGAKNQLAGNLSGEYLPYMDSLTGSLEFLSQYKNLLSVKKFQQVDKALTDVKELQSKFRQAEQIRQYIRERKQQLQTLISGYSKVPKNLTKMFNSYNEQVHYYSTRINEYKDIFRDPARMQRLALIALNKIPAFQKFMKEHSTLGGLFSLAGNYGSAEGLVGLQSKEEIQKLIAGKVGSTASAGQAFGQQIQAAQSQLSSFKEKLLSLGAGSGDIDMPDFFPNRQKTKTFLKRLEYGINIQNTRSSGYYVSTTDIGFSVGYKASEKITFGFGGSYKIGWGKDIRHIAITSEGAGFRSFFDIKLKKEFFASGGFEYNYQRPFAEFRQISNIDDWQQSGLIGISRIISVKSKVFGKTKVQILWDFLSYQQVPRTQSFKFRVGYNF